jgi:predicted AlkP superfamily phosphohydrolase/phosphomutase
MTRLLTIALDGATLDLLQPWMDAGELPLLARLFREGSGGVLNSTVPWATPTAFASFATGMNPGKHGVYDFGRLIGRDYTAFVPTNGADVHGRTLWHLLSEAGISSGIINMPMTYPAAVIDGFIIAGIPYPGGSPRVAYPTSLLDKLRAQGWDLARNASDDLSGSYADYYAGLLELIRNRGAAAAYLIRSRKPDFAAVHFLETDQVQHRFWQFMPGEPRYDPHGPHSDAILRLYQVVEEAMAQILDAAGDEVTLCVMSDHGFGPTRTQVWLNNWLVAHGFLALKPTLGVKLKKLVYRLGLSPAAIREAAPERLKLAILQFFERQKGRALAAQLEADNSTVARKGLLDRLTERLVLDFYDVDWRRTRAFSTGTTSVGYVWLNVTGRDPQGIIAPGAVYEETRQAVATQLRSWPVVGQVLFREEVWHGPQLDQAPDIVVRWASPSSDARYFQTRFSSHHLSKPVPNDYAGHRPDGLFLLHGKDVAGGQTVTADIVDLAPTFLWLLDQPVLTSMDGQVLAHCFTRSDPVTYVEVDEADTAVSSSLSSAEEEAILNSLRNLGYIE